VFGWFGSRGAGGGARSKKAAIPLPPKWAEGHASCMRRGGGCVFGIRYGRIRTRLPVDEARTSCPQIRLAATTFSAGRTAVQNVPCISIDDVLSTANPRSQAGAGLQLRATGRQSKTAYIIACSPTSSSCLQLISACSEQLSSPATATDQFRPLAQPR
jgi:hypothetical protein